MKGKERACQIKGMLWLDNETLEVNMSAIFGAQESVGNTPSFQTPLPVITITHRNIDRVYT